MVDTGCNFWFHEASLCYSWDITHAESAEELWFLECIPCIRRMYRGNAAVRRRSGVLVTTICSCCTWPSYQAWAVVIWLAMVTICSVLRVCAIAIRAVYAFDGTPSHVFANACERLASLGRDCSPNTYHPTRNV